MKKICEHLGLTVNRLIRIAFGPFQLGDLERGGIAEVPAKVLAEQLGRKVCSASRTGTRRIRADRTGSARRGLDPGTPLALSRRAMTRKTTTTQQTTGEIRRAIC